MLVEFTTEFAAALIFELAFGLGHAVHESVFRGPFRALPLLDALACYSQIDDFSHAITRR
jgi:hypothetical protein